MARTKAAFLGSISSQVFMVVVMSLSIVTTPLLLKYLNKEEYGFVTILFQVVGYLSMFDFGLGNAMGRYLSMHRGGDSETQLAVNRITSTGFFAFTFLGVLVCIAGFLFSSFFPSLFNITDEENKRVTTLIVRALTVFVALQFPLRVFSSIFFAHQRQVLSNTTSFLISILNAVLPLVFLSFQQGLWSFVYTYAISSACSILLTVALLRRHYRYIKIRPAFYDKALLTQMFGYGFFLFLNAIAVQIVFYTDRFFVGAFVSLSAVAVYSITARIPEICRDLIFRITDNAFPAIVEINSKEGKSKFNDIHQKLLLITVCCSMMAFWMVLLFNDLFIRLWVGDSFFAGNDVLLLVLILMLQHSILHVSAVCLNGAGIVKGFSVISLMEAAFNFGLTFWLGRIYGIKGILLATIIAGCLTSVWYTPYAALRYMQISLREYLVRPVLLPTIGIAIPGLILFFVFNRLFHNTGLNWLQFLLLAGGVSILFGLYIWKLFLEKELKSYIPERFRTIPGLTPPLPKGSGKLVE